MTSKKEIKIYENLGQGIEVIDAETYNKPLVDFARNMYHAFLYTGILVCIIIFIAVVIPSFQDLVKWSFEITGWNP